MTNELSELTNIETGFEYIAIPELFNNKEITTYFENIKDKFNNIVKEWTRELNHEWVLRNYISVKLILSSTLMLNSLDYSINRNVRIVEPYLAYYCLHNVSRAFLLTLPTELWRDGKLLRSSHSRVINILTDKLKHISQSVGHSVEELLYKAKDYRELFSYRFPSSGIDGLPPNERVTIKKCERYSRLICEMAQFHSEILQCYLMKNITQKYQLDNRLLKKIIRQEYMDKFLDPEDSYRLPIRVHYKKGRGVTDKLELTDFNN